MELLRYDVYGLASGGKIMLDKLQIFTSIVATMIVTFISLVQEVTLDTLAIRLIAVIITFYVLGLAARIFLKKYVFFKLPEEDMSTPPEEDSAEESENADEETVFENFNGQQPRPQRSKYD